MQAIALVRASSMRPLHEFAEAGGAELRWVRDRMRPAFRPAGGGLLPVAYGGVLFEAAARASGLDDLGLRLGAAVDIDRFGAWGSLIARSATVGAFLQSALASHRDFNTGYRLWTVTRGDEVWLHQGYCRSLRAGRAQVIEHSMRIWLGALRRMLGPTWKPDEIHLEGEPPRHAGEIEALAARRVAWRQPTMSFVFPRRTLARRAGAAPLAAPAGSAEPVPASSFAESVQQAVASLLQLGVTELRAAAEAGGMSERSFQRHLGERGLCFSEILEAARFEAARRLLADPAVKVIDVSAELGYSDSANFTRAFRRWTGVAPQAFRRAGQLAPASAAPR